MTCKQVARLVSESLDHELPAGRRFAVRAHLMLCRLCARYRRQILALRGLVRQAVRQLEHAPELRLSDEARARIRHALRTAE